MMVMIFSYHVKNEFLNILKTLLMCIGPLGFRYTLGTVYPRETQ